MKDKKKKYLSIIILLLLLVGVTVGYATLSSNLNISGTSSIGAPDWDVHFENLSVKSGSVSASAPTISSNKLNITYSCALAKPGDYYEFTVDVKNAGTIDAKLSALPTISGVSTAQDVYVNYTFTHTDGTAIAAGETLAAGASKNFTVKVEFDKNITSAQLPTTAQELSLVASMNYEQV